MAMVGDDMGAAILAKVQTIPGINITNTEELSRFCNAFGEAIVEYIKSNADVLPAGHTGPGLENPSGQPVSTPAGAGATSAPEPIIGMGSIV